MTWVVALAAITSVLLAVAPETPGLVPELRPTHRIDVTVTVSAQWSVSPELGCGPTGSGSTEIKFSWRRPARAHPEINSAAHRWTLLVPGPGGGSALDLGAQRIRGTITFTDHTTMGGGAECTGTMDHSGCHSYPLSGTANVFGIDRRRLRVLASPLFGTQIRPHGSCLSGAYVEFNDGNFFTRPLTVRMPPPGALHHRRVVARGSDEGRLRDAPFGENDTITETVTQTAVVTLRRLPG